MITYGLGTYTFYTGSITKSIQRISLQAGITIPSRSLKGQEYDKV